MILDIKLFARQIFPQIEDLGIRANFCKKLFYPATIKNENGAVATREFFGNANGNKKSINF